LEAADGG
ncbi:hypothetical protein MKD33_14630, partial [Chromobacterium piscinae]